MYSKLKKYIFYLSFFFSALIIAHVLYAYLYSDSLVVPKKGGTISIGFIGDTPSLNPLEFGLDSNNDYILQYMYRSLLRYNIVSKKMEGDLANCDLGKNFSKIKCYIKDGETWSDGTPVTKDDIIDTYLELKNNNINKYQKSILGNIEIRDNGGYLEFSSKNADILLLDAFTIPVVKSSEIVKFTKNVVNGNNSYITNGAFTFFNKEYDSEFNSRKITLLKNENSTDKKNYYFGKIVFKFFQDKNNLTKNESTLNVVIPQNDQELFLSPRFEKYDFLFPQYIGMFLNIEKINNIELRKNILFQLESATYPEITSSKGIKINNPFLGNESIKPDLGDKNFISVVNSLGFYKKDYLITETTKKYDNLINPSKSDTTLIPNNNFIKTPSSKSIHFYGGKGELLISGNVPAGIEGIYMNEFKLQSFVPGNTKFYFRATSDFKTLKTGVNNYNLYFEVNGKKVKKETLTVYYYTDKKELEAKEKEIISSLSEKKSASVDTEKLKQEKEIELKKIQDLDNSYFYDKNLNKFTLKLHYINEGTYFSYFANKIKDNLRLIGINVLLNEITQNDIQNIVLKGEKNYDILLTGVNHGLFDYNIFPFYHSSQAKVGYNFSKIKDASLDLLLEKLKTSELTQEKINQIKKESLEILKKYAITKTFFSPYSFFYIDRNIKNTIENATIIPYKYNTYDIIKNGYIKEDRIIKFEGKNPSNFLIWLKRFL